MLKVRVHAGDLDGASAFNCLAWMDIGYQRLDAIADYRTVLFQNGTGATMPTPIYSYPRWSASLWDLTARALALGLREDWDCLNEEVPAVTPGQKRFAFANRICAFIEHETGGKRKTLAHVSIQQVKRNRGTYIAQFTEHTMAPCKTKSFEYKPVKLRPAELLLHACLMRLTGTQQLPPRPTLCIPQSLHQDDGEYISVHSLVEPARTGFLRWLACMGQSPISQAGAKWGIVHEKWYAQFLKEAV